MSSNDPYDRNPIVDVEIIDVDPVYGEPVEVNVPATFIEAKVVDIDDNSIRWGCSSILLLAFCLAFVVTISLIGGAVCYWVTSAFGEGTTGARITGGVCAFVLACLTTPIGAAIYFLFLPSRGSSGLRSGIALIAIILLPFVNAPGMLIFPAFGAIGWGLLNSFEPLRASIICAILFPLVGLCNGMGLSSGGSEGD